MSRWHKEDPEVLRLRKRARDKIYRKKNAAYLADRQSARKSKDRVTKLANRNDRSTRLSPLDLHIEELRKLMQKWTIGPGIEWGINLKEYVDMDIERVVDSNITRRRVLKVVAYTAPVILKCLPSFASSGSANPNAEGSSSLGSRTNGYPNWNTAGGGEGEGGGFGGDMWFKKGKAK